MDIEAEVAAIYARKAAMNEATEAGRRRKCADYMNPARYNHSTVMKSGTQFVKGVFLKAQHHRLSGGESVRPLNHTITLLILLFHMLY